MGTLADSVCGKPRGVSSQNYVCTMTVCCIYVLYKHAFMVRTQLKVYRTLKQWFISARISTICSSIRVQRALLCGMSGI